MRIAIGTDPGTANYGYSVISFYKRKNKKLMVDILEAGMFLSTVTNLTTKEQKPPKSKRRKTKPMIMIKPFRNQFGQYLKEWSAVFGQYKYVKKVCSERFQTRGIKGMTIEAVSMMNGAVATLAFQQDIDYEIITAATWKNALNKVVSLDDLYIALKLPNHIIDACFIAVHGVINRYKLKWTDVDIGHIVYQLAEYTYEK